MLDTSSKNLKCGLHTVSIPVCGRDVDEGQELPSKIGPAFWSPTVLIHSLPPSTYTSSVFLPRRLAHCVLPALAPSHPVRRESFLPHTLLHPNNPKPVSVISYVSLSLLAAPSPPAKQFRPARFWSSCFIPEVIGEGCPCTVSTFFASRRAFVATLIALGFSFTF